MDREDIIRMAQECQLIGRRPYLDGIYQESLERFHQLAVAAEREKVAAWMIQRSYATGHGDTTEDLLVELEWQVRESEREACAQLLDDMAARDKLSNYYAVAAKAIRERGQT